MKFKSIYAGKVDWDKILFYHEKECHMGELSENTPRAEFHLKVIRFLEKQRAAIEEGK